MEKREIRRRNDEIRESGLFGPDQDVPLYITKPIDDMGESAIKNLIAQFQNYTFQDSADLHDIGTLHYSGVEVHFKIENDPATGAVQKITFFTVDDL